MQDALEGGGYDVAGASSGDAAMALLQEAGCTFSGLITDIRLGDGRDGWALARCARELIADICVLYVTGDSAADWSAKGVSKSLVLQKPVANAQLLTAISMLLNEQAGLR